jgi:haloacetate dehalogenase
VQCPVLMTWSTGDDMEDIYGDPLEPWRAWVADPGALRGIPIDSGHHQAEEAPQAVAEALIGFLGR